MSAISSSKHHCSMPRFLDWFMREVGEELASMQLVEGTDLATDQLWCRAAGHFGASRVPTRPPKPPRAQSARPSCAVIPVAFRHLNRATIPQTAAFWHGSHIVRSKAAARWPQYWVDGPLLKLYKLSSNHVEEKKGLQHDRCLVRRFSSRVLGPACPNGGGSARGIRMRNRGRRLG